MDKLTVGLEWFLNPDHMLLILGIEKGWFKEESLEIEMIEPKEHFDALDEIENGSMRLLNLFIWFKIELKNKTSSGLRDIFTLTEVLCITKIKISLAPKI